MAEGEERVLFERFLSELREFAADADFKGFSRGQRSYYRVVERRARRELAKLDPIGRIESYLGMSLESRCHYLLTLLYQNNYSSSFIEPYPDPNR